MWELQGDVVPERRGREDEFPPRTTDTRDVVRCSTVEEIGFVLPTCPRRVRVLRCDGKEKLEDAMEYVR